MAIRVFNRRWNPLMMPGGLDTFFFPGCPVFCGYPYIYIFFVAVMSFSLWSPKVSVCDNGIWVMEAIPSCRPPTFSLKRLKNNHPDVPFHLHSFNESSSIALLNWFRIRRLTPLFSSQVRASPVCSQGRWKFFPGFDLLDLRRATEVGEDNTANAVLFQPGASKPSLFAGAMHVLHRSKPKNP